MAAAGTPKTVLLAEDHEDTRIIYRTALRHAGYRVVEGDTGAAALDLARRYHPDCIILDLRMPVMDGWKAMELIRAEPDLARTPVMALSVIGPGEDRRDPIRRGFDAYFTKPFAPDSLISVVESWIGPSEPRA